MFQENTKKDNLDVVVVDDDWVNASLPPRPPLDMHWMKRIFPEKEVDKCKKWLQVLLDNEFECIEDLQQLSPEDWKSFSLPLGVESRIKKNVVDTCATKEVGMQVFRNNNVETIASATQVDVIVVDISASMRARSHLDEDKTREDVSKMLFHTMIDKLICLELHHAVGLLAFGSSLHIFDITDEYEQFHDFLGRLDANEGGTMLYDAIHEAVHKIECFESQYPSKNGTDTRKKRIFVLTDGQDNRSQRKPWQVAQLLQEKGIQLDAIPLATFNPVLQSMCTASGGLCFGAKDQEQAVALFGREATLHLAYREKSSPSVLAITCPEGLKSLEETIDSQGEPSSKSVTEIRSAVPSSVKQEVMKKTDIKLMQCSRGNLKRILKEYNSFQDRQVAGWKVYINANDMTCWKATFNADTNFPPYSGGTWLLTIDFPPDFPFKPPKVKFITPIYHCNISNDGNICLDLLKDSWNPAITVTMTLVAITELLNKPNPEDPLDAYKGQLCRDNFEQYMAEASSHTKKNAVIEDEIMIKLLNADEKVDT